MAGTRSKRTYHAIDSDSDGTDESYKKAYNVMRNALDEGALTLKSRDRTFTTFLDLKNDHHNEFMTRLREHVQLAYQWDDLEKDESERRRCATSFVRQYGNTYWGTEENRRKYLLPDSLKDRKALCTYPERKEEIILSLMLLLQKKANSQENASEKNGLSTPGGMKNPRSVSEAPFELRKSMDRKSKKRASDLLNDNRALSRAPSPELLGEHRGRQRTKEVRAFTTPPKSKTTASSASTATAAFATGRATPSRSLARQITSPESFGEDIFFDGKDAARAQTRDGINSSVPASPTSHGHSSGATITDTTVTGQYKNTSFLVSGAHQTGMAPVHVPFQAFVSSSAFLECMVEECGLTYWDPSMQLNNEISQCLNLNSAVVVDPPPTTSSISSPSSAFVIVASVKLDWSNFFIRVRPGKDQDWAAIMYELEKARKAQDATQTPPSQLKIHVTLHLSA
ncbi:hypothetical protein ASPZODRAFT_165960 [Penicilliopsis zonata CBS 506.65]|uniref:Uncharacterized protein n=1 Tax=Penicilliopsis zonata CBS 506.65 TaxID=1073090 RepID=A0A1L9SKY3_9EURO|nr:hypothetical protein ASPZODRAFT_165960 [Penicilliopsis zonata CBS 506.65]OJJ47869.1 hypothetical protein ASPZODRAFT_165960 [Penicilliopsis zonata CBS 506.65]